MKVMIVKELMTGDVSPVAMFGLVDVVADMVKIDIYVHVKVCH